MPMDDYDSDYCSKYKWIEPNNVRTMQIGWALGEEFKYVVLGDQYYLERIDAIIIVIIHKRPFEISHNNQLPTGCGDQNGLSYAGVELNFKNLNLNTPDLSQSYLTIQEHLQIDRYDWVCLHFNLKCNKISIQFL